MTDHWPAFWLAVLLGVPAALYTNFSDAFSQVPPGDMTCAEVTADADRIPDDNPFDDAYPNDRFIYIRCEFPPHISKYVRADSIYPQYAVVLVPRYPTKKLGWTIRVDGYSARPTGCALWPDADYGAIVMRHCPDHHPDAAIYQGSSGTGSWGGPVNGKNPLGWRMAAVMKYVNDNYGRLLDKTAGATLKGCSYGGTTSILQSMLIPDPWARALVNKIDACVPHTLAVKSLDPTVQAVWGIDTAALDFRLVAAKGELGRTYYRVNGATNDHLGVVDLEFFRLCDQYKIACFGTWHQGGHSQTEPGVNLPFTDLYSGPRMEWRLDRPKLIFTNSTANHWGVERGHFNLGFDWIFVRRSRLPDSYEFAVRYLAQRNIGGGIPNQPATASVSITIPDASFSAGGVWSVFWGGKLASSVLSDSGSITFPLTLESSESYTTLEIFK